MYIYIYIYIFMCIYIKNRRGFLKDEICNSFELQVQNQNKNPIKHHEVYA